MQCLFGNVVSIKVKYCILGTSVSLECSAVGNPPPQVTWRRVVGSLPKDRAEWLEGALKLNRIHPSDDGEYILSLIHI